MVSNVKIGSMDYEVKSVEDLEINDKLISGYVTHWNTLIQIDADPDCDPQQQKVTLLHEIVHVILEQAGLQAGGNVDERVTTALSYGLYQVLAENPKLIEYITGLYFEKPDYLKAVPLEDFNRPRDWWGKKIIWPIHYTLPDTIVPLPYTVTWNSTP